MPRQDCRQASTGCLNIDSGKKVELCTRKVLTPIAEDLTEGQSASQIIETEMLDQMDLRATDRSAGPPCCLSERTESSAFPGGGPEPGAGGAGRAVAPPAGQDRERSLG
ncbi:unnamed protein product [Merluccius merluccius]